MDLPIKEENVATADSVVHLICHAHLDPVWLWEWEEGLGSALATLRSAADLCETHEGFVFNQNEALLYEWVEEHEPALFERIRKLVDAGRWHIMGGWYLQPDCNLPSGESMARQIERGQRYFSEKFGQRPKTAINFDSFGHSQGLVQILAHFGFDSYLVCRPDNSFCPLPANAFVWRGTDTSEVLVRRIPELYNTALGQALKQIEARLNDSTESLDCVLWGVGNHGGGPSRQDLADLAGTEGKIRGFEWTHGRPEDYFSDLEENRAVLPVVGQDLNRWAVGCYTSQVRIKQEHRRLENDLFRAEKMAVIVAEASLMDYPMDDLLNAERDLLISEFHDILPGSSIQSAEEAALRLLGHGREIVARVAARAFFAMICNQAVAMEGDYPLLVFNPHPYALEAEIDAEFQMADQNWSDTRFDVEACDAATGEAVPIQVEKEASNMPVDWRKRVVLHARLEPSTISRFNLRLRKPSCNAARARFATKAKAIEVGDPNGLSIRVCRESGHLLSIKREGREYLGAGGCGLEVCDDVADSWIGTHTSYGAVVGEFNALASEAATEFSGIRAGAGTIESVRVIEEGPVRTVVEVLSQWGQSRACLHYRIPSAPGQPIGVSIRVFWNERYKALKLRLPLSGGGERFAGQTMFGRHELPVDGTECAFQQWCAAFGASGDGLLIVNSGTYGGDCSQGKLRPTLLRSPGYSAHAWDDLHYLPDDRFVPLMDQGERKFEFWIYPGAEKDLLGQADQLALRHNQLPYVLQAFPGGEGEAPPSGLVLDDLHIVLTSLRCTPDGDAPVCRLFNPTAQDRTIRLEWLGRPAGTVHLPAFKFCEKTLQPE